MKNYSHVLRAVLGRPWAILPSTLGIVVEVLESRLAGIEWSQGQIEARLAAGSSARGPRGGGGRSGMVAVIPVYGTLAQRSGLMAQSSGGTSTEGLSAMFREAMADEDVGSIVFDIDSPGGLIEGVPELAAEIRAARGQKPMVANANAMAASAALWIGTAADEFVVTPSGQVGSIGIVTGFMDDTAAREQAGLKRTLIAMPPEKIDGWGGDPLSEEGTAEIRAQVEEIYGMFVGDVAKQRNVSIAKVRNTYGGRMYTAKQALAVGLVDGIETLSDSIRRASRKAALRPVGQAALAAFDYDTDDDGALAALPFAAHSERVLLDVAALAERAGEVRALRIAAGRDLSAAHRERLEMIASRLDGAKGAISAVLDATIEEEPPEPEAQPPAEEPVATGRNVRNLLALAEADAAFTSQYVSGRSN